MALFSKLGNILRQSATKKISSEASPFKLSFSQAIRCMSSMSSSKLFIGGESCVVFFIFHLSIFSCLDVSQFSM